MAKHRAAYWLVPAFGLTFAAGWFGRGVGESDQAERTRILTRNMAPGAGAQAGGSGQAGPGGSEVRQILPLNSLAEILQLLSVLRGRDELAMVPVMEMLPRLMVTDIATVRRLLDELGPEAEKHRNDEMYSIAAGALLFRWMTLQPEEAAVYALGHTEQFEKLRDMAPLLVAYAGTTRAGAGERLLGMVPEQERERMGELLRKMQLLSDPAGALRDPTVLEKLKPYEIHELAAKWARQDPSGLLAWRLNQPEGERRSVAERVMLQLVTDPKTDPAVQEKLFASLPPELAAGAGLQRLANEIRSATNNTDASAVDASAYAAKLRVLLAQGQPDKAVESALQEAVTSTGQVFLRQRKFQEASLWVGTLPAGAAQREAAGQIAAGWVAEDPAAASGWIDSLPPGESRDEASGKLIESIKKDDPATALVWANSIRNEEAKAASVKDIYSSWFQSDPVSASQAVQSLPPDQQQLLMMKVRDGMDQAPDLVNPEMRRRRERQGR